MDVNQILNDLKEMGNDGRRKVNIKNGVNDSQFGVPMSRLRPYAKKFKNNTSVGLYLWMTGNFDAMVLATMVINKNDINLSKLNEMLNSTKSFPLVDELCFNLIAKTEYADSLKNQLLKNTDDILGRAGWCLAVADIESKKCTDTVLDGYLEIIKEDMQDASPQKQDMMNRALSEIGIWYPSYTDMCIQIGHDLGVYKDYQPAKGCYSPFAPEWIKVGIAKYRKD